MSEGYRGFQESSNWTPPSGVTVSSHGQDDHPFPRPLPAPWPRAAFRRPASFPAAADFPGLADSGAAGSKLMRRLSRIDLGQAHRQAVAEGIGSSRAAADQGQRLLPDLEVVAAALAERADRHQAFGEQPFGTDEQSRGMNAGYPRRHFPLPGACGRRGRPRPGRSPARPRWRAAPPPRSSPPRLRAGAGWVSSASDSRARGERAGRGSGESAR